MEAQLGAREGPNRCRTERSGTEFVSNNCRDAHCWKRAVEPGSAQPASRSSVAATMRINSNKVRPRRNSKSSRRSSNNKWTPRKSSKINLSNNRNQTSNSNRLRLLRPSRPAMR